MAASNSDSSIYPAQPSDSVIRLHEATADRLVLDIPPGKKSGGLGCFAVIWNGFMVVFTAGFVFGYTKLDQPQGLIAPVLFVGLFWLVGFGLIYAWLKLKYERSFLLVERDRAVLRKMFLGRQRQRELPLDETSQAELTEAYSQNDVPVYRVTVTSSGGDAIHFGTSLEPTEKDWCVDAVNTLLQPKRLSVPRVTSPAATVCEACGEEIPADAFRTKDGLVICPACEHEQVLPVPLVFGDDPSADPSENVALPDELPGVVTILEDSPERLGLQLSVTEFAAAKWLIGLFAGGFACVWYAFLGVGFFKPFLDLFAKPPQNVFDWFGLLFTIPFLLGGLVPLGMGLLAFRGRITTWIDRELVKIRLHVGPFGKTWTMHTADVTAVRLIDSSEMPSNRGNRRIAAANPRAQGGQQMSTSAGICAGSRLLAMTAIHQPLTARFVVKKVRTWLNENLPEKRL